MDGRIILILAGIVAACVIIVYLVAKLRNQDSISSSVDIPGIGKGQIKAGNNPRDAVIRDAEGREITADAPLVVAGSLGRRLSGGNRDKTLAFNRHRPFENRGEG